MEIIKLIIFTLSTWLIHLGIASTYIKHFESARSVGFRVLHSAEIAILITLMLLIAQTKLSAAATIAVILGTLAIADLALFGAFKSLRQNFDVWHFVVAYTVVAVVILFVKSRS